MENKERDKVIQIYDNLDERRKHLVWVYIQALSGGNK